MVSKHYFAKHENVHQIQRRIVAHYVAIGLPETLSYLRNHKLIIL